MEQFTSIYRREDVMTDYEVFGNGREKGCSGGDITHLAIKEKNEMWPKEMIVDSIENKGDKFWSYVYKNGTKDKDTKIEVEVIDDDVKGKYLRTQTDPTEENNLLELPIFAYNNETKKWEACTIK
jgi:hypothetical protein